jgi:hypothetical protein
MMFASEHLVSTYSQAGGLVCSNLILLIATSNMLALLAQFRLCSVCALLQKDPTSQKRSKVGSETDSDVLLHKQMLGSRFLKEPKVITGAQINVRKKLSNRSCELLLRAIWLNPL